MESRGRDGPDQERRVHLQAGHLTVVRHAQLPPESARNVLNGRYGLVRRHGCHGHRQPFQATLLGDEVGRPAGSSQTHQGFHGSVSGQCVLH